MKLENSPAKIVQLKWTQTGFDESLFSVPEKINLLFGQPVRVNKHTYKCEPVITAEEFDKLMDAWEEHRWVV